MKILTILGTRPEIIRLSRIIPKLDKYSTHTILHTGQNYTDTLSSIFFEELGIRQPDIPNTNMASLLSGQLANIFLAVERTIQKTNPDKILILGDTNSALSAVLCERLGVPVYHMEAGNRCFDSSVPEEKNRIVIDKISTFNIPYTEVGRQNLIKDNIPASNIFVSGNPIGEVLSFYEKDINASKVLEKFNLKSNDFILVTSHRAENVNDKETLSNILGALNKLSTKYKIVFSCHPRTRSKIEEFGLSVASDIILTEPLGFFDFVHLEKNCMLAITDSGTVQEEMCILKKPTVTIRNSTERQETIWCGSNILAGTNKDGIINLVDIVTNEKLDWELPLGYNVDNVSDIILNILLGK